MDILLIFLFIFDFRLIKGSSWSSTSFLVLIYLLIWLLTRKDYRIIINNYKYYRSVLLSLLGLIFISLLTPVFHSTFDFSYFATLLHQFICLSIGVVLLIYMNCRSTSVFKAIILAFFSQSLIQLGCFISPLLLNITDRFRDDSLIALRYQSYRGFRGLAISGSAFFGLAVAYGIVFILFAFYFDSFKLNPIIKIIMLATMTFGAISAGRTSILGIFFFILIRICIVFSKIEVNDLKRLASYFGSSLLLFGGLYFPISKFLHHNQSWQYMRHYLFQFIGDDNGSISLSNITSLNHLFNDMYFKLSLSQFLIGDGRYTGEDGLYYMHTDVGLMRNILFFGIFGTLLLLIYFCLLLFRNASSNGAIPLAIVLFVFCIICEFKGQVIGFLIISQSLLLLIVSNYNELQLGEIDHAAS